MPALLISPLKLAKSVDNSRERLRNALFIGDIGYESLNASAGFR